MRAVEIHLERAGRTIREQRHAMGYHAVRTTGRMRLTNKPLTEQITIDARKTDGIYRHPWPSFELLSPGLFECRKVPAPSRYRPTKLIVGRNTENGSDKILFFTRHHQKEIRANIRSALHAADRKGNRDKDAALILSKTLKCLGMDSVSDKIPEFDLMVLFPTAKIPLLTSIISFEQHRSGVSWSVTKLATGNLFMVPGDTGPFVDISATAFIKPVTFY